MRPFFQHNGIRICHGNCLQVLPSLETESIDFCLTDPPFLVANRGRWDGVRGMIIGDDDPTWLAPAFSEIFRVMKKDTFCVFIYGLPHADLFVGL